MNHAYRNPTDPGWACGGCDKFFATEQGADQCCTTPKVPDPTPSERLHNRLTFMFYMMMRDHMPTGTLQKMVNEARQYATEGGMVFDGGHLRDYAASLVDDMVAEGTEPI